MKESTRKYVDRKCLLNSTKLLLMNKYCQYIYMCVCVRVCVCVCVCIYVYMYKIKYLSTKNTTNLQVSLKLEYFQLSTLVILQKKLKNLV